MDDMPEMENLATEVEETEGIWASFEAFVNGLLKQIQDLKDQMVAAPDKEKLTNYAQRLNAMQARMAAAMAANPAPGEVVPPPTGSMGGATPDE